MLREPCTPPEHSVVPVGGRGVVKVAHHGSDVGSVTVTIVGGDYNGSVAAIGSEQVDIDQPYSR